MLGLEAWFGSVEAKIVGTIIVTLAAGIGMILIRGIRRLGRERLSPVMLDLAASTVIVAIVVLTTLVIADIWGQTDALFDQLGFLRIDARAPEVIVTIVVLIAIQVFTGISRRLLDDLAHESNTLTDHQREVGVRISQLALWTIGLIVILGVWDIDLTGILVGAGFLGIVLGLAARKTLGSLMAGLVLMFSRPVEVGDWVAVDGHDGVVTDITLMSTRIRSFNGERVIVPNDVITGEILVNRSREGRLRVEQEVGIDYDDDVDAAVELAGSVAATVVEDHEKGLEKPPVSVLVRRLDDSAVTLSVRLWLDNPRAADVNDVRHQLIERLKTTFDEAGISFPFPQQTLSTRPEARFPGSDGETDED